ncbi:hypothetical protein DRN86_04350 [Candidatus Geothermarchaeota archaeon]|nr:MAG: hypothetical protein DRN86_04350 [Candidatus Geothermarchaeota archaeon]
MPEQPTKFSEEKMTDKVKKPKIHTMPEKFYIEEKGGKEGKNTFLILAIIILVVVILGGGAFLVMQRLNQSNEIDNENLGILVNVETNTNTTNTNVSTNINANVNTNANTNVNTNVNIGNINLFANMNANTNTTAINVNAPIPSSQDTDSDGLTDVEEGLFGTNVSLPDSDNDSYTDGQEVISGYNPNGSGKLESSAKVQLYTSDQEGYNLLYPAAWAVADDPQNTRGKIFTTSGEFVSVSVQENPARLSARDWYLTKSPGVSSASIVSVSNWDKTLAGVQSVDGLTIYYTKGDKVYIISYNTNILSQANFKSTFTMMYKSFKTSSTTINTNTGTNMNANTNTNSNRNTNTNSNNNANSNSNANLNSNTNSNTNTYL